MIIQNPNDPAGVPVVTPIAITHRASLVNIYEQTGKLQRPVAALILTAVAMLIYWPALMNQFQYYWDDHWVVMNQYTEQGITLRNLWGVLTEFYHGQYAPVNELSYMLLYAAFGYNPFWFHLTGVLVHLANIWLLFYFMDRLQVIAGVAPLKARRIAFITALLLAIHPFIVESVAWVSASKIILYVLFYLIALNLYLSYLSRPSRGKYWQVLLCFILSFGAKEQAVVFPVCLLLVDYVTGRSLKDKKVWREKLPFFLLAFFFGILTIASQHAQGRELAESVDNKYPFYQNVVFAFYCLSEYLSKCFIPVKLLYLYPFPILPGEALPLRFWMYPAFILAGIVLLKDFWKQKWVFFGLLFFVIHIVITIHIIPTSRFTIIADRYVYLAATGAFFLMALLLEYAATKSYRTWAFAAMMLYFIALGMYTFQRVHVWYDSDTLKKEIRELVQLRNSQILKSKQVPEL